MRPKPAYPEENTSGKLGVSEETVHIRAAEKGPAFLICGPATGLVIKPGFLCLSLNPRGFKGQT